MTAFRALVLLLSVLWLGCGREPVSITQIVAVVDSDLDVPSALDRVTIEVAGLTKPVQASADLSQDDLPRSLGLVHSVGPLGPIRVRVRGFSGSTEVVERLAIVSLERARTLELRLPLSAACAGAALDCAGDTTCDRGRCVSAQQDDLPLFKGTVKGFRVEKPPGADAGLSNDGAIGDNQQPECTIHAPDAGAMFGRGESVSLTGSCEDPESGPIGVGLSWESSLAGMLGSGAQLNLTTLQSGLHTISLCARDPLEPTLRGCTSVAITVAAEAVVASIVSLTQGSNDASPFTPAAALEATGTGTGQEPLRLSWIDSLLGPLGEGETIRLDAPAKGKHTWTLLVTDASSNSATDSRSFVVTAAGEPLIVAQAGDALRFDTLAAASNDGVCGAGPARQAVYGFDGTDPSSAPRILVDESQLPDEVRDIALDEQRGFAYLASRGFLVCPFDAAIGIAADQCSEFRGGMLGSDECNAVLPITDSNSTSYLLVGTSKGLLVATPDGSGGGTATGTRRLTNVDVRALAAVDGIAWIATAQGLYSLDPESGASQRYGLSSGAPSDLLHSVASGSDGSIWVGSSNGLGRFVPTTRSWTVWRTDSAPSPGLAANDVRDVAVARTRIGTSRRDIVWIATANGLSRLDPSLPSFTSFGQEDGLPSNSVRAITVLSNGVKVFATDVGVATYDGI